MLTARERGGAQQGGAAPRRRRQSGDSPDGAANWNANPTPADQEELTSHVPDVKQHAIYALDSARQTRAAQKGD